MCRPDGDPTGRRARPVRSAYRRIRTEPAVAAVYPSGPPHTTRRAAGAFPSAGRQSVWMCSALHVSAVHVFGEQADPGQVTVALGVVQPVADDELCGDVEADVADLHFDLDRFRLAQQSDHVDALRAPGGQVLLQPGQG